MHTHFPTGFKSHLVPPSHRTGTSRPPSFPDPFRMHLHFTNCCHRVVHLQLFRRLLALTSITPRVWLQSVTYSHQSGSMLTAGYPVSCASSANEHQRQHYHSKPDLPTISLQHPISSPIPRCKEVSLVRPSLLTFRNRRLSSFMPPLMNPLITPVISRICNVGEVELQQAAKLNSSTILVFPTSHCYMWRNSYVNLRCRSARETTFEAA